MKKIILLILLSTFVFSCKNTQEKKDANYEKLTVTVTEDSKIPIFQGEFIYLDNAAVLKGANFIYGVTIDDMAKELAEKVKLVKQDEFDMVPVIVRGIVANKPEGQEGWDEFITIKVIVSVSETPSEADIKIEGSKE